MNVEAPPASSVTPLIVWTIYRNPSDFPGKYVVRAYVVGSGCVTAASTHHVRNSLDSARSTLPANLVNLGRAIHDSPAIVETWV